eukprot:7841479-Pyramimonas_sp.AAC.1
MSGEAESNGNCTSPEASDNPGKLAGTHGAARSRLGQRGPRLRWTAHEPTKVTTVASFAATQRAA